MTSDDFKKAVADVQPLKRRKRVELKRPPAPPIPRQSVRDEAAALAESLAGWSSADDALESDAELSYLRDGMARLTLRKLRRGHWAIQTAWTCMD